jgi:hypothetical protein
MFPARNGICRNSVFRKNVQVTPEQVYDEKYPAIPFSAFLKHQLYMAEMERDSLHSRTPGARNGPRDCTMVGVFLQSSPFSFSPAGIRYRIRNCML